MSIKIIQQHYFEKHTTEEIPKYLRGFTWQMIKDIATNATIGLDRFYVQWNEVGDTEVLMFIDSDWSNTTTRYKSIYTINLLTLKPTKASHYQTSLPFNIVKNIKYYRLDNNIGNFKTQNSLQGYMFVEEVRHECNDELCESKGKIQDSQLYCREKDDCLHGRCNLSNPDIRFCMYCD